MPEKQSGSVRERANESQILFLTLAEVDDRSFGGAIRSADMRDALQQAGHVDTLVIHGASRFALDAAWDERRVKHATFGCGGLSLIAFVQRRQIRAWVERTLAAKHYDVIVACYLGLALFVQLKHWRRLVLDADDIFKTPPASASGSRVARPKFGLRNGAAAALLRLARHVWVVNPRDGSRLPSRRTSQLPNAVSLSALKPTRAPAVGGRILMVGYFEHPPNADLQWFARQIWPALVGHIQSVELNAIDKPPSPTVCRALRGGVGEPLRRRPRERVRASRARDRADTLGRRHPDQGARGVNARPTAGFVVLRAAWIGRTLIMGGSLSDGNARSGLHGTQHAAASNRWPG